MKSHHCFREPKVILRLLVLSNQQFKSQRDFIYYPKWQRKQQSWNQQIFVIFVLKVTSVVHWTLYPFDCVTLYLLCISHSKQIVWPHGSEGTVSKSEGTDHETESIGHKLCVQISKARAYTFTHGFNVLYGSLKWVSAHCFSVWPQLYCFYYVSWHWFYNSTGGM